MRQLEGAALDQVDDSDTSLVDDLRHGSSAALGALFDRHADAVFTYCFRRTACWHTAEDLTSGVFLELWRGRARVREHQGSALPWLYGIARNVCRNSARSGRRLGWALSRLASGEAPAEPDPSDDVVRRLDGERRMAAVRDALATLPAGERDVLELVVWAGLDYEAAAAALGIPVGTVRSRLSRARARLTTTVDGSPTD